MESGLDLLRSGRIKERHLLTDDQHPPEKNRTTRHASVGTSDSRVSNITREQTVMMQVARSFNVKDGQLSSVLACGNPAEERRLAAQLKKIEDEKRRRESTLAWNQRNFFIKQVFDQDNELRFVKAYERPSYLDQNIAEDNFEETIFLKPKSKSLDCETDMPSVGPKKTFLRRSKTEGALLVHRKETSLHNQAKNLQSDENDALTKTPNIKSDTTTDLPKLTKETTNMKSSHRNSAKYSPENSKPKVKFPLLKVRALGIFAASFRRNENDILGKENVRLPTTTSEVFLTSTENVNDNQSKKLDKPMKNNLNTHVAAADDKLLTNTDTIKEADVNDSVHYDQAPTDTLTHLQDVTELKSKNNKICLKTTEYKLKNIGLASTNTTKNDSENKFTKHSKLRETLSNRKPREKVQYLDSQETDEQFQIQQEKVLRKLVSTLPTHLLLKTHKREKEAGGISTDDVRKKMIDKARAGMSRSVLKDPRFKNLEEFLNAGQNATYNPKQKSNEILEHYEEE